ncbi:putative aldouronate transport system substrate-binding protein [Lederbergia galactosidilyticus]|uniref:extracellular solute-binding protein n=1 Tax=Lederbergia galactosidilytica TaxID=217031 RepID=UPI001AEAA0B3|nr:extracellular solute-binding protein [Lederbergia galactosidilytica]MBP1916256.1 putative aldouronate transport system substrate-binding protein [Lederbergia galactosidilytica]
MKNKKILYVLLMMSFIFIFTACNGKKSSGPEPPEINDKVLENFNETGMPIVNEPITLNFMAGKFVLASDQYNETLIWRTYEEMSNIHINWELVPYDGREEKRNLTLAGGTLPDVFYTMSMPNQDLLKYGQQEVFITMNDLIEEYMPNLTALLDQYPDIRKGITFPDGNIYSLPTIYDPEFTSVLLSTKGWIRQDWLEKLEMDMPETLDDFYQYLKAVKETDLNENGKNDEIPFGATDILGMRDILKGAFGVGNRGSMHAYLDEDPDTGELRFYPLADDYKALLEYLNKLYAEGLIQENIYSIEQNQSYSMGTEGLYGSTVIINPTTIYGEEMGKKFVALPALEGPAGNTYHKATSPLAHMGGFVVTSENKHIPATLRWMDYFYSKEGAKLFFMGLEGETFEEDENGDIQYVDKITNSPDGLTMEQELSKYITWIGGGYPGIVREETFKGSESLPQSLEAAEILRPNMLEEVWPSFTYTVEENNKLSSLQADIHKYVDEMQDKFITGTEPLAKWDEYVKKVEKMGLKEYMEIQKSAYERYKDN